MSGSKLRWVLIPLVAAIVLGLDQYTKGLIEKLLPLGGSYAPLPGLEPYLNLVHTFNTGAAFGLLQGQGGLLAVVALVIILVALIYTRFLPVDSVPIKLCLGLQLGGALGNLVDRLEHSGRVTDFVLLTLPLKDRVLAWPAFNVADSGIVVGTILLMILLLVAERKAARVAAAQPGSGSEAE